MRDDGSHRASETDVRDALRHIVDPEIGVSIVDSGSCIALRWRAWGGLLNAAALLLFMFNTGRSMAWRGNHGNLS